MVDDGEWRAFIDRLVEAASQRRELGLDRLNHLLPVDFPLEDLDELYESLYRRRVTVIDEQREARLEERRKAAPHLARPAPVKSPPDNGGYAAATPRSLRAVPSSEGVATNHDAPEPPSVSASFDVMEGLTAEEQMDLLASPSRDYLGRLAAYPRLSEEEEETLTRLAANGDQKARQLLVSSYLPLVARLAKRYRRSGIPYMELVLAGNEGLVEAVDHHVPREGASFARTARWWVRQRLSRCVGENWQGSKIPRRVNRQLRRMVGIEARYRAKRGREPSPALLCRAMRISIDDIFLLKGLLSSPLSLHAPLGSDGEALSLADQIADLKALEGATEAERDLERSQLEAQLARLDVIERQILVLRFGFGDRVSRSLGEVARLTGLSPAAVREGEERGLEKLRAMQQCAEGAPS